MMMITNMHPYNPRMWQFLLRRAWIGILLGLILILLPNAFLRTWLPIAGPIPTPSLAATANALDLSYQQALQLAAADPLASLPFLEEVAFSSHPNAESARSLAQAIQAARLADDPAYLLTTSGQALAAIGEWRLAQQAFLQAVQLDPEYAEAWAYLGEAQQQNDEDGLAALERAMDLNAESLSARLFMALYWQRQQEYSKADAHYRMASLLEPENASIQLQWGQNSLLAGDLVEAREHFDLATEITKDDIEVSIYVARYCIEAEVFVEELGLQAALTVLRSQPQNPEAMVLVGRAYLAVGNPVTAEVFLQQAAETHPGYAPGHYYYALFLLANNEASQAFLHLNKVIELAPGSPEAELASELIVQYSH
jgi:tetratricopeptide (TPR) repeat protein